MSCEKCVDLCLEYEIRSPDDLRKAFAVARDNVADHSIRELSGSVSFLAAAKSVAEGGPWPDDHVSYQFECTSCGERFNLNAETYHGRGGEWVQASASWDAKLKKRIIGNVPRQPGDPISMEEWIKQHQIGFLSVVGLIVFSVMLFIYLRH